MRRHSLEELAGRHDGMSGCRRIPGQDIVVARCRRCDGVPGRGLRNGALSLAGRVVNLGLDDDRVDGGDNDVLWSFVFVVVVDNGGARAARSLGRRFVCVWGKR